ESLSFPTRRSSELGARFRPAAPAVSWHAPVAAGCGFSIVSPALFYASAEDGKPYCGPAGPFARFAFGQNAGDGAAGGGGCGDGAGDGGARATSAGRHSELARAAVPATGPGGAGETV